MYYKKLFFLIFKRKNLGKKLLLRLWLIQLSALKGFFGIYAIFQYFFMNKISPKIN